MMERIKKGLKNILLLWTHPIWAMTIALLFYSLYARMNGFKGTPNNYFVYLADAFLHGQMNLRITPPNLHDLVIINDKIFLYWLPMPAILVMPLVGIFGITLSDVILTILFGAMNVYIFTILLYEAGKRHIHNLDSLKQALLVIFFSFGTVHFTLTPYGKVWQFSQLVSVTFVLIAYLIPICFRGWKAFLITGIALTCAMLTRSHLIFIGIWPVFYLIQNHIDEKVKNLFWLLGLTGLPVFMGLIFIVFYNMTRFGDPFELGVQYHNISSFFVDDFYNLGYFNMAYIPRNLYYHFLYYPLPATTEEWKMGGSLFLLSPVFLGVFYAFHNRNRFLSQAILIITILMVYIPSLVLVGTGWVSFGPRYTLDFIVPFLLLTAQGVEKWSWKVLALLCLISILQYSVGTYMMRLV